MMLLLSRIGQMPVRSTKSIRLVLAFIGLIVAIIALYDCIDKSRLFHRNRSVASIQTVLMQRIDSNEINGTELEIQMIDVQSS